MACGRFPDIASAVAAMTARAHLIEPDPRLAAVLDQRYSVYCRLHEVLRPYWQAAEGMLTAAKMRG